MGVCISLDRQEKVRQDDSSSAIEMVQKKYQLEVISIANLSSLISYLEQHQASGQNADHLQQIQHYQEAYGTSRGSHL